MTQFATPDPGRARAYDRMTSYRFSGREETGAGPPSLVTLPWRTRRTREAVPGLA
jgi:hypothetical protein